MSKSSFIFLRQYQNKKEYTMQNYLHKLMIELMNLMLSIILSNIMPFLFFRRLLVL